MLITGYADTENGVTYCCNCVTIEDEENFSPIFSSEEWDFLPICEECRDTINVCTTDYESDEISKDRYANNEGFIIKEKNDLMFEFYIGTNKARKIYNEMMCTGKRALCHNCFSSLAYEYTYIINQLRKKNLLGMNFVPYCCHCKIIKEFYGSLLCPECKCNKHLEIENFYHNGKMIKELPISDTFDGIIVTCEACSYKSEILCRKYDLY